MNHSSESYSLQKAFYARIKASELKNVEKLGEETFQALKSCYNGLEMCIFVQFV